MAASQNSSLVVNLKPMAGMRTTTALITNQVANEKINEKVVTPQVRQASALPCSRQKVGSSGFQFCIFDMWLSFLVSPGQTGPEGA
jgi:hypothetical protein